MEDFRGVQKDLKKSEDLILVRKALNGIACIIINRPKSLNSLTKSMITDLAKAFKGLDKAADVKVIIITGAGRAFCSGVDLTAAQDVFKGDVKNKDIDAIYQMEHCRKPIIGAINGYAVTAGLEIALACDILVASTDAKFVDTHSKFGIFPSWGLSQKLPRIIGVNRAKEVSLTATPLDAHMAEKWGLVSQVVLPSELMKTAERIAEAITRNHEDMVLRYKAVINEGMKLPLGDALELEKERAHSYYEGMPPEQFSAMQKFISGRSSKDAKTMSKLYTHVSSRLQLEIQTSTGLTCRVWIASAF
eukprot:Gb_17305 [translate_table: standard]